MTSSDTLEVCADICIACCFDERMVVGAHALLASILDAHASGDRGLSIHLVKPRDLDFDDRPYRRARGGPLDIVMHDAPAQGFNAVAIGPLLSPATFLRLALADILPVDKVLYLDCDVIVLRDLSALFDTDLGDNYLGAVADYILTHHATDFNLVHGGVDLVPQRYVERICRVPFRTYFNAGVLLLNLREWRRGNLVEAVTRFIQGKKDLFLGDQDALNAVVRDRRVLLDPRWNAISYALYDTAPDDLGDPEWRAVIEAWRSDPWIVHFVGPTKLWLPDAPRTIVDARVRRYLPAAVPSAPKPLDTTAILPPPPALQPPLVSIIVVNFNYAAFLRQCVTSIILQSYPAVECILVDNGSTDGSDAVIEELQAEFDDLRVVRRAENGGQARAWMDGFAAAAGKYVMFVDADDYLLSDAVACHIAVHLCLPNSTGFTSSDMVQVEDGQVVLGTYFEAAFRRRQKSLERIEPARLRRLDAVSRPLRQILGFARVNELPLYRVKTTSTHWMWSPASANMFRKDAVALFIAAPGLETFRVNADTVLNFAVNAFVGSVLIDRPLSAYRLHRRNNFSRGPSLFNFANYDKRNDAAHRGALVISEHVLSHFDTFSARALSDDRLFDGLSTLRSIASDHPDRWRSLLSLYASLRRRRFARSLDAIRRKQQKASTRARER